MKGIFRFLVFVVVFSLTASTAPLASSASAASNDWTWSLVQGKQHAALHAVVELAGGVRIAVGDNAAVFRSDTEGTWDLVPFPVAAHLTSTASNGNIAVVAGDGVIAYTKDGLTWRTVVSQGKFAPRQFFPSSITNEPFDLRSEAVFWHDVVWDGRQFVAVGRMGHYFVSAASSDGSNWKLAPMPTSKVMSTIMGTAQLSKFKGSWIAVHGDGIFYSPDATTWTFRDIELGGSIHDVAENGENIVAVGWDGRAGTGRPISGTLFSSSDGVTWERQSKLRGLSSVNGVTWDGAQFIAVGHYGTILLSTDGSTWENKTPFNGSVNENPLFYVQYKGLRSNINAIMKSGGSYIAVGEVGTIRTAAGLDETWKLEAAGTMGDLYGIEHVNGTYLVAGNGTLSVSTDLQSWSAVDSDTIADGNDLYELSGTAGTALMTGYWKGDGMLERVAYAFADGQLTNVQGIPLDDIDGSAAISRSLRLFGGGKGYISYDAGKTWAPLPGVQAVPTAVSATQRWIGYSGDTNYVSADGIAWKPTKSTVGAIEKAIWDGNRFVGIYGGSLYVSYDGITWTPSVEGVEDAPQFGALAVNPQGVVAAVGRKGIYLNEDRKKWTKMSVPVKADLRDVLWDGRQFVAVGEGGVVIAGKPRE